GREHQPFDLGAIGDADVEAQLLDVAVVGLGLVALADELAGHVLGRADDEAHAAIDVAGEAADLNVRIRGRGRSGKNYGGERSSEQFLHGDMSLSDWLTLLLSDPDAKSSDCRQFGKTRRHPRNNSKNRRPPAPGSKTPP